MNNKDYLSEKSQKNAKYSMHNRLKWMQKFTASILSGILVMAFAGCMSFVSVFSNNPKTPRIYGGVRGDIQAVAGFDTTYFKSAGPLRFLLILDLPFSLVFDTIFLPVTVTRAILDQSGKSKQENKKQLLVDAVRNGEIEKVSILLSEGISPDLAVSEKNDKIYEFPESSFYEDAVPILYLAFENHHINAAEILLENNTVTWPASRYAVLKKNKNIIHAMISNGISADEFYEYSVRHDSLDMADFSLSRGANVNLLSLWDENQGGEFTALLYFIKKKNKNGLVWLLKKKGIYLNFTDHFGSALHHSVRQEDPELLRILSKSGVNRNLKDNRGRTARQLAEKISDNSLREEILKYL